MKKLKPEKLKKKTSMNRQKISTHECTKRIEYTNPNF